MSLRMGLVIEEESSGRDAAWRWECVPSSVASLLAKLEAACMKTSFGFLHSCASCLSTRFLPSLSSRDSVDVA